MRLQELAMSDVAHERRNEESRLGQGHGVDGTHDQQIECVRNNIPLAQRTVARL